LRGTVAATAGMRSGWMTSAYLIAPTFFGLNVNGGGQAMQSDYIEFYSLDAVVMMQIRDVTLQLQSQTRNYVWLPLASGLRTTDNYSEISAEYPLRRHLFMSAAAGGFFRTLGDEGFKPQFELRLITRI